MFTNKTNIPLSLAVWLAYDEYDHDNDPNTISATGLLNPIRSLAIAHNAPKSTNRVDISSLIASRMGTALHGSIEAVWSDLKRVKQLMLELGYNQQVASQIKINPKDDDSCIPVYMEKRSKKKLGKYTISGKFDFVMAGKLEDFKSTGTYSYTHGSNVEKYMQQGSIYRWLNPKIITEPYMSIQYIFTDWSAVKAKQDSKYPQSRLLEQKIPLMSIPETELFMRRILDKLDQLKGKDQFTFPRCTPEELWQKDSVFKYYKNPNKVTRSTANFKTYAEAQNRLLNDNNVGIIKEVKGEIVRCRYCHVVQHCDQAKEYLDQGILNLG